VTAVRNSDKNYNILNYFSIHITGRMHDLIIVGGGIAGLRVGIETLRKNSNLSVIILEKYDYIGGRIITHHKDGNQWEIGAARISKKHTKILSLIEKYHLTSVNISDDSQWRGNDGIAHTGQFSQLIDTYMKPLQYLDNTVLRNNTLADILAKVHGHVGASDFLIQFPYWAEVYRMRADLALNKFTEEMSSWSGFVGISEGLSALINAMSREFRGLGGYIETKHEITDIKRIGKIENVYCTNEQIIKGSICVIALHRDAVAGIRSMRKWSGLQHIKMDPLFRMYAVFPNSAWFKDLPTTIVDSPVRLIIPMTKGAIMISYTDGADAIHWIKMLKKDGADAVKKAVMHEIRKIFCERGIPDPIEFKLYPWYSGCSCWIPGNYDPAEESVNALCVREGLFCCGESWSLRQAWMEGALEHADMLLANVTFQNALYK
jgi:Flavin containing amine oxidoreductase